MKTLLWAVSLLALSMSAFALRNGCEPGTPQCGNCQQNPSDPLCSPGSGLSGFSGFSDLNADYLTDILWWDMSYYNVKVWMMNGITRIGDGPFLTPRRINDPNWRVVATGYFGPGRDTSTDVVWQNDATGQARIWLMNGTSRTDDRPLTCSGLTPCTNPSSSTKIVATGYFDRNGMVDILWRDDPGALRIWLMNGTTVTQEVPLSLTPSVTDPSWRVEGTGFFDTEQPYDYWSDILWWNKANGQLLLWKMNGTSVSQEVLFAASEPDPYWKLVGTGDFNREEEGNQYPDLLWRNNQTGKLRIWVLDGTTLRQTKIPTPDGRSDLTWKPIAK